jgi:hypothetical protein
MRVLETFEIGRGLVIAVEASTSLPAGKRLIASVTREDGTTLSAVAFKEWLLRREPRSREDEAYLLPGLKKADVPIGSDVSLELAFALGKAHSADAAAQFRSLGWSLAKEFRVEGHSEPYEYLFEWHREEEPVYPTAR